MNRSRLYNQTMKMNLIYPNYINIINFVYLGHIVVVMHHQRHRKIANENDDGGR